jgi:hypothetical protein
VFHTSATSRIWIIPSPTDHRRWSWLGHLVKLTLETHSSFEFPRLFSRNEKSWTYTYTYIYICVCLFIYLFICLFTYLLIYLCIYEKNKPPSCNQPSVPTKMSHPTSSAGHCWVAPRTSLEKYWWRLVLAPQVAWAKYPGILQGSKSCNCMTNKIKTTDLNHKSQKEK